MWQNIENWFYGLSENYNVDPLIFGAIYVGAIPFFMLSITWLVRNKRMGKSITIPALFAGFFFISAYLYLAIFGENIPYWVWAFLGLLIAYGIWSTLKSVREKVAK